MDTVRTRGDESERTCPSGNDRPGAAWRQRQGAGDAQRDRAACINQPLPKRAIERQPAFGLVVEISGQRRRERQDMSGVDQRFASLERPIGLDGHIEFGEQHDRQGELARQEEPGPSLRGSIPG